MVLIFRIIVVFSSLTKKKEKKMKALPGIVIGLAIGTLVGIMLAPDSGRKTRKKVSKKLSSESESFFKNLQDQLQSGLDTIKERYDEYVDTASAKTNDVIGQAKRKLK